MKHLKTIFACLLMAVLSIGQVWAADAASVELCTSWSQTFAYATAYTHDYSIDDLNGGTTTMTLGVQGVYRQANAHTYFQMNKKTGYFKNTTALPGKITKIETTWNVAKGATKCYFANGAEATSSDATVTVSAGTSVTYTPDNAADYYFFNIDVSTGSGSAQMTSCVVYYEKAGGGSTPSVSVSPSSWDFGTVHASAEASKVFSVSGSNLTAGDLTLTVPEGFSVSPSSISVDGTLAATNVTVAKNTSDVDDYEGNLEITGGGLENAKTVALTMTVDADPAPTGTFELFSGDIEEGDYVLVGYQTSSSKYYAMNSTVTSNQYLGITEVSIDANDQIVNPDASLVWTIEQSTNGYYIKQGSAYLDDNATSNKNYAQTVAEPTTTSEWTFAYDNTWTITNYGTETTKKTLSFNISASRVACYTAIQSGNTCFYLYKKVDGTVLPSAGLAFDAAQKLAKVAGTLTAPNLSTADGFDGTVTYASSDEAVVKVNASTGAITDIVAAGKAVITAHSEETENFREGSASYTIFVAEQAGTNEDPLTEASAKALIDDGCTLTVHVNGLVLSQNSTNFTVTLTNGFQFYKAKDLNNVAFESAYLGAGDEVTAVGALKKFSSTYELDEGCYLTFYEQATTPLTPIANDKDHPYTVAQALAFAAAPTTYDLSDHVFIQGVVYKANSFNSDNGTYNIYIKDAGTSEDDGKFEFYKCAGLYQVGEDVVPFAEGDVQEGDEVIGYGVMSYYSGGSIWQFGQPNQLVSLNRPEVAVESVELASTASVAIGKTINLSANVLPANATDKAIAWSIVSGNDKITLDNGAVTGVAEGTAVVRATAHGDNTKYADCTITVEELSVWATTYTNNVAVAHTGSGEDNGTITIGTDDPYKLVKAGASSNTGTIVVTVPVGTTDLHFHAFAWNGKTAKIQLSGVENASQTEFNIAAESGATGSGNDFTLEGDPVDQYFHVSFDAVAAETEITFSKADGSADNRFFFYGVNQVGGLALESIYVSGTASVLEYTDGQHFDPAGLSVIGHYTDDSEAEITEGITWAYDPDPLTEGTESVSVTATAGGFTSAAFVVDGLNVAGAAPLSPWASVYTSNVEIASNTAAHVTINEENFDAAKTSKGASATITLPQGVTTIHLHLVAWSGEAQTVSVTGDCFNEAKELSIEANAGVSGGGTTYDLGASGTDYYFSLTPDKEVAANTVITIAAASGKRFVLFGVNQEGGVVPVLKSIEISGDLTKKSGYKVGDDLDLDGLTVSAIYTLNEVDQAPVDVTSLVNWSYDPLVEGQTSVTITATLEDKSDDITISDLEAVASADPKIYVSTLNVDFGSVEVGEAVPGNETVTVTLTNVAAATATLDGEGFEITPTALTASGDITISVIASTTSAANYSATLTISDDATENPAESKVINLSFAVIEPVVNEEYELVSDVASLAAGDQIIIVAENAGTYYTLDGSISSQYFPSTAVSISAGIITAPSTSAIILGKDEDNWTMSMGGQLIGATAAKKASLGNGSASNTWTIAIAENVATITNTTTTFGSLQFNYNGGSNSRFLNYTSAQTAVAIYKKVAPEPPTPATPDYTRDVTNGHYGTICLPKAGTIEGASIFEIAYYGEASKTIFVDEITSGHMGAGVPYIFQATAAQLKVTYDDNTDDDVVAGEANGLHGFYDLENMATDEAAQKDLDQDDGNYILYNNQYWLVSGRAAYINNFRAYIKLSEISPKEPALAPGRRRVAMAVNGTQTATGIEDLNASEKPMKMMINGQIFILRGEKMYDTTGRLVK